MFNQLKMLARNPLGVANKLWKRMDGILTRHFIVPRDAQNSIRAVKHCGKRGLFLDLGSNIGQGYSYFSKHYTLAYFDYELYEPNPNCTKELKIIESTNDNVVIHQVAISSKNEDITMYGICEDQKNGAYQSRGASISVHHNTAFNNANDKTEIVVRAVDFSALLASKANSYDIIIVKMDIEGAEYDVLEKIIADGTVNHITSFYIEFHSRLVDPSNFKNILMRETHLRKTLASNPHFVFREW